MSAFKSEKLIGVTVPDIAQVGHELIQHFQERGFEVTGAQNEQGGWDVDITKGGIFKAALGLRTCLKIEIQPQVRATLVRAGAGIFGRQAVPSVLTLLVAWPVLIPQIWGLISQANLDDEAMRVVEVSLNRLSRLYERTTMVTPAARSAPLPHKPPHVGMTATEMPGIAESHCTNCGQAVAALATFCAECGQCR